MAPIIRIPMLAAIVAIDRRAGIVEYGRSIVIDHIKRYGVSVSAPRVATPVYLKHDVRAVFFGPVDILNNLGKKVFPVVCVDHQGAGIIPIDSFPFDRPGEIFRRVNVQVSLLLDILSILLVQFGVVFQSIFQEVKDRQGGDNVQFPLAIPEFHVSFRLRFKVNTLVAFPIPPVMVPRI